MLDLTQAFCEFIGTDTFGWELMENRFIAIVTDDEYERGILFVSDRSLFHMYTASQLLPNQGCVSL